MHILRLLNVELVGLIVAVLGSILAVLALVVGLWHLKEIGRVLLEAKTQADEAKTHTNALEEVRRSLSTHYIGTFPAYYEHTVGLITRAQTKIVVFCDEAAYGSFSKRRTWFNYHSTLERKVVQENVRLELTCLDEAGRRESVRKQFFGTGKDWKTLKTDANFLPKLQELLNAHRVSSKLANLSQQEFEDLLELEEAHVLEDLQSADIHETKAHMPLYFWLIDSDSAQAEAVFTIPSFSEKAVEYGFSTTDQRLISAFVEMRDRYHRDFSVGPSV
jgi:hypothetical protein